VWERNTANSDESGDVSFDSPLDEPLKFLCELGMSRELPTGQKDTIPTLVLASRKRNISDAGTHQTNNDGESFERSYRVNLAGN